MRSKNGARRGKDESQHSKINFRPLLQLKVLALLLYQYCGTSIDCRCVCLACNHKGSEDPMVWSCCHALHPMSLARIGHVHASWQMVGLPIVGVA